MWRKITSLVIACSFLGGAAVALAQDDLPAVGSGDAPSVTYKKKTVYDFDDDLVEGELQRPDGEMLDVMRRAKHSSLIKIRENFIPEMLKSADDI